MSGPIDPDVFYRELEAAREQAHAAKDAQRLAARELRAAQLARRRVRINAPTTVVAAAEQRYRVALEQLEDAERTMHLTQAAHRSLERTAAIWVQQRRLPPRRPPRANDLDDQEAPSHA